MIALATADLFAVAPSHQTIRIVLMALALMIGITALMKAVAGYGPRS